MCNFVATKKPVCKENCRAVFKLRIPADFTDWSISVFCMKPSLSTCYILAAVYSMQLSDELLRTVRYVKSVVNGIVTHSTARPI